MPRRYFGTDGVRGVVGEDLTADLVERIGRAATLWSERSATSEKGSDPCHVLIGRDTRGSGPELEAAIARGIVSVGGTAVLAGVLPTPAVALLAQDLGVVISASHNPPEYNGVKLFHGDGSKLTDEEEEVIEALLEEPVSAPTRGGSVEQLEGAGETYLRHVLEHFGQDLSGVRIAVDCANGAFAGLAPKAFEQLGAEVHAIGVEPDGTNINVGCGATDLAVLSHKVVEAHCDLGVAFDGDGDRMLAVDERGEPVDGDQILAILALALGVDTVAVTVMTNLGFHRLMAEHGIRVVTTPVGDRYVLEALRAESAVLGGEQSGHVIWLRDHVTGDGLAAALLLCGAIQERTLGEAASALVPYPQSQHNVHVARRELPQRVFDEADRLSAALGDKGRVLVRLSGTEPVVRVLAEAETQEEANRISATIARLVDKELG
ncbi:MAG: phosphoglucosamine mutase [Actinobacteria bacterium]|nr:phosphoglucosamine mutase [Actinomycetota bacterium]